MEHVHYAIRDVAVLGDQLAREGNEILHLNIGDPLVFDFQTPSHLIEAVYRAMRDGKNGYAPSLGIDDALERSGRRQSAKASATFRTSLSPKEWVRPRTSASRRCSIPAKTC